MHLPSSETTGEFKFPYGILFNLKQMELICAAEDFIMWQLLICSLLSTFLARMIQLDGATQGFPALLGLTNSCFLPETCICVGVSAAAFDTFHL